MEDSQRDALLAVVDNRGGRGADGVGVPVNSSAPHSGLPTDLSRKLTAKEKLQKVLLDPARGLSTLARDAETLPSFTKALPSPSDRVADGSAELARLEFVLAHLRQWQHSAFPHDSWEAYLKSVSTLRGTQRDWVYRVEDAAMPPIIADALEEDRAGDFEEAYDATGTAEREPERAVPYSKAVEGGGYATPTPTPPHTFSRQRRHPVNEPLSEDTYSVDVDGVDYDELLDRDATVGYPQAARPPSPTPSELAGFEP